MNGYTPAVFALARLHAELGGKVKANRSEAKKLVTDMKHVEAVLKLLDPTFNVRGIAPRRRNNKNPWFKKGEVFRHVIDMLRCAQAPMTAREITEALLRSRGVEPETKHVRYLLGGVQASLRNHEGKTIERIGEGMPARWKIIQ